jgi:hypothetical protein
VANGAGEFGDRLTTIFVGSADSKNGTVEKAVAVGIAVIIGMRVIVISGATEVVGAIVGKAVGVIVAVIGTFVGLRNKVGVAVMKVDVGGMTARKVEDGGGTNSAEKELCDGAEVVVNVVKFKMVVVVS